MAKGSSRAYKLQLSAEGIALFLRCHDRLCRAIGDLLPYGSTLFVAVALFQQRSSQDAACAFLEPGLERMGGKMDTSKNQEIWPVRGIEDHAGALMPDFRPSLPA